MDKSVLALTNGLSPGLGFAIMVGLGVFLLALSFAIKTTLVRNTHDFIIADRKVGSDLASARSSRCGLGPWR
jgi:hypothetical protein